MTDNPLAGKEICVNGKEICINEHDCKKNPDRCDMLYDKEDVDVVIKSLQDEIKQLEWLIQTLAASTALEVDKVVKEKDALIEQLKDHKYHSITLHKCGKCKEECAYFLDVRLKEKDAEIARLKNLIDNEHMGDESHKAQILISELQEQISTLQKELKDKEKSWMGLSGQNLELIHENSNLKKELDQAKKVISMFSGKKVIKHKEQVSK